MDDFTKHLTLIMKEEKKTKNNVLVEPPTMLPKQRVTPIVGGITEKVQV